MKYCGNCDREIDTDEEQCPVCQCDLVSVLTDEEAAMIAMTVTTSTLLL